MKLEELSRILLTADPAAVLVPRAVLERVIRKVTGASWAVWSVPHSRCFIVDRFTLFKHVEQDELALPPDHQLPQAVMLLERPSADRLASPREELLARYWRLLFHITIHRELGARLLTATTAEIRQRIDRLGSVAFEEARNVLIHDGHLDPRADEREAYIEFAAFYLELRLFAWNLIGVTFPSLPAPEVVDAMLGEEVNAREIFERTRLPHAPDPSPKTDDQSDESHDYYYRLDRAARRAASLGDTVNAAILHTRAARVAPVALSVTAQAAAIRDIQTLVDRLQHALDLTEEQAESWRNVLPALLDKADQGYAPVEAALLLDLQRACLDHEQKIYTLDVVEWVLSAGHRPIKRELDGQKFVRVPAQLRSATRRLTAARLSDADRQALATLLRDALQKSEDRLRQRFRPVLTDALHDAGMRPGSLPEEAALSKTVEELLDRISAVGFLTFADLRDAIARGQVKLPDLNGSDEYLHGDLLLRLDRRLATLLDGIYRRGEFYARLLERITSLAFGTETGRWITRNIILPVGGAFLTAQFIWLLVYERRRHASSSTEEEAESFLQGWNALPEFHLAWLVFAGVLLGFVRSPAARDFLRMVSHHALNLLRLVFWEWPLRLWSHPLIRALLTSLPMHVILQYLIKPALLSWVLWKAFPDLRQGWIGPLMTYFAAAAVINSRPGRNAQEVLGQALVELVNQIRAGLIPGLIRWVADLFKDFTAVLEWVLARGDDWLRLRGSGGPLSIVVRVLAGLIWFPFAFLLRFYLVVLIEPMINPLKLPLSLLFAKFVYPLLAVMGLFTIQTLSSPLVGKLAPYLTGPVAWLLVIGTFYLLPDAVTYLFWEMRENWRLYRANRPESLRPAAIGPHGETIAALLRPGFHSGTVPRLYGKLREAERRGAISGIWQDARAHREALREVAGSVKRFVSRELAAVLNPSPAWGDRVLTVEEVRLGTNRIRVELALAGADRKAILEWEERSGWLVAGWAEPGWVATLPQEVARSLGNALAYLYKRAKVDLVREQIRAELPPSATRFDIVPAGLFVWYGSTGSDPVLYDIAHRADDLRPRTVDNLLPAAGPALDGDRLVFSRVRLTWAGWLAVWPAGRGHDRAPAFGPDELPLMLLPPLHPALPHRTEADGKVDHGTPPEAAPDHNPVRSPPELGYHVRESSPESAQSPTPTPSEPDAGEPTDSMIR